MASDNGSNRFELSWHARDMSRDKTKGSSENDETAQVLNT